MSVLSSIASIAETGADTLNEYLSEVEKRKKKDELVKKDEQNILLLSKKNEVDRSLSDFFSENFRVEKIPEDYNDVVGMYSGVDRTGLTDESNTALNQYIDSSMTRKFITVKEYQTRHLADGALANAQALYDDVYNNLREGDTTLTEAMDRSNSIAETLKGYYTDDEILTLKRRYDNNMMLNYAKSMSYETLAEHLKSGFFQDKTSNTTLDQIHSLALKKYRLDKASKTSKVLIIDKALERIASGEIHSEAQLAEVFGDYTQHLIVPYRAAQEYMGMTSGELRAYRKDLEDDLIEEAETRGDDIGMLYKYKALDLVLQKRAESLRVDPISYAQAANVIYAEDPSILDNATSREMDEFLLQRKFDVNKLNEFFGIKSTKFLSNKERQVLVNRFNTTDSAEIRLKIVSAFGGRDNIDSYFPGSTAAAHVYNSTKDSVVANLITNRGVSNRDVGNKSPEVKPVVDSLSFATPGVKTSYESFFF